MSLWPSISEYSPTSPHYLDWPDLAPTREGMLTRVAAAFALAALGSLDQIHKDFCYCRRPPVHPAEAGDADD